MVRYGAADTNRDIKPRNILWRRGNVSGQSFSLPYFTSVDLGLSNFTAVANALAEFRLFHAPELYCTNHEQTPEMGIWSLLMTMIYPYNEDARSLRWLTNDTRVAEVERIVSSEPFSALKDMAVLDVPRRATAGDMLLRLYDCRGATTSRKEREPLMERWKNYIGNGPAQLWLEK